MWIRVAVAVLLAVLFVAGPARAADVEVSEQARTLFREGVKHLKDPAGPQYAEAYAAFSAAYDDSPSPKMLGNIGLCAMKLERDGEAIDAYEKYLKTAGAKSPRERLQIIKDLKRLKTRVATLELSLSPASATITDRRVDGPTNVYQAAAGDLVLRVRHGKRALTIEAPTHEPQTLDLELKPGATVQRDVALVAIPSVPDPEVPPAAPPEDSAAQADDVPWPIWLAAGVSVAAGIAWGVVGGLAASNKGDFDDAQAAGDAAESDRLSKRGNKLNIAADVMFGTTMAGIAVTGVLLVLWLTSDGESDDGTEQAGLAPLLGPSNAGLVIQGHF